MNSKMQIIGLPFLLYLIQFLMNFYEILENNTINVHFVYMSEELHYSDFFFSYSFLKSIKILFNLFYPIQVVSSMFIT